MTTVSRCGPRRQPGQDALSGVDEIKIANDEIENDEIENDEIEIANDEIENDEIKNDEIKLGFLG